MIGIEMRENAMSMIRLNSRNVEFLVIRDATIVFSCSFFSGESFIISTTDVYQVDVDIPFDKTFDSLVVVASFSLFIKLTIDIVIPMISHNRI